MRRMTNGNEEKEFQMITRLTRQMTEEIAGRRCDSETKRKDKIAGRRSDYKTKRKDKIAGRRCDPEMKGNDKIADRRCDFGIKFSCGTRTTGISRELGIK